MILNNMLKSPRYTCIVQITLENTTTFQYRSDSHEYYALHNRTFRKNKKLLKNYICIKEQHYSDDSDYTSDNN